MSDHIYMKRALVLAQLGFGETNPNPMVGCVIVNEGFIIGEGYHKKYGEAHAEVNAINSVNNKELLKTATAYVSLEPCSHFGKTPPCADLLIKYQIKKVVVCNLDPNPLVSGKGIQKLLDAGIEVSIRILEAEGLLLNRRFFTAQTLKRPYIILKWAETADGFIADESSKSLQISNEYSNFINHKWRTEEDGILIGTNTAVNDNPKLNSRNFPGKNPKRIIIDKNLKTPKTHHIYDKTQETYIFNSIENSIEENLELIKIEDNDDFLDVVLKNLIDRNLISIIVEGGAQIHKSFIEKGLYDEIRLIKSDKIQKSGIKSADVPKGIALVSQQAALNNQIYIYQK